MYSFSRGKILIASMFLVGAFLLGSESLSAQQSVGTGVNPEVALAQRLGVTAYNLGTFDRTHAMDVFEQIRQDLRPQLQHNPPMALQLKFAYVDAMLNDVKNHIATEITLLTSLNGAYADAMQSVPSQQTGQNMAQLYTEIVAALQ